jgi:histidinol-phosphate aminotransferase
VELIESPLEQTNLFSLSLDHVKASWQPHCKMIILCNPNNPTGGILNLDFIAEVCSTFQNKSLIVVDEAYIEFANTNSAISLLDSYDNLIILRTLSKAYGLAGIRLGSIIAQESIIATLTKIIAPYTISSPTLRIATQALIKVEWFQSTLKKIIAEREQLLLKLPLFQWIEQVYTSQTNFILLKTPIAQNVADYLEQHQIGIRQFLTNPLLRDHLRITVGTEEQNALLLTLLSTIN